MSRAISSLSLLVFAGVFSACGGPDVPDSGVPDPATYYVPPVDWVPAPTGNGGPDAAQLLPDGGLDLEPSDGGSSAPDDGGVAEVPDAGPACQPTTCAALGANCGTVSDGCGSTLDCGTCTGSMVCGGGGKANVCAAGACVPATCTSLGKSCVSTSDGCGKVLECACVLQGAILARYQALGGISSPLGKVSSNEQTTTDGKGGKFNTFEKGAIFWRADLGANDVYGPLYTRWVGLGREKGTIGYPKTGVVRSTDGVGTHSDFESGAAIYQHPSTGARLIYGGILAKWRSIGAEKSAIGYPTTDEANGADGTSRVHRFQDGTIVFRPNLGTYVVQGLINGHWRKKGAEGGFLGLPKSSEQKSPNGRASLSQFEGGAVYWVPVSATSGWLSSIRGGIWTKWKSMGAENSFLGFPIKDEFTQGKHAFQDFEHGYIWYDLTNGQSGAVKR